MSKPRPKLAFCPFHAPQPSDEFLADLIAEALHWKLDAAQFRFCSSFDREKIHNQLGSAPLSPESAQSLLEFHCVDALISADFKGQQQLSLKLRIISPEGERNPVFEAPEERFFGWLNECLAAIFECPALETSKKLRERAKKADLTPSFEALKAYAQAKSQAQAGDLKAAEASIRQAQGLDPKFFSPLQFLADCYGEQQDLDKELALRQEAVALFESTRQPSSQAEALLRLGQSFVNGQRFKQALETYEQCLKLSRAMGLRRVANQARNNRANIFYLQGQFGDAIAEYLESLKHLDDYPNDQAFVFYNLSLLHMSLGDHGESLKTIDAALELARKQQNHHLLCRLYNARGSLSDLNEDYEQALSFYRQAEEHALDDDDPSLIAGLKDHMAITYRNLNNYEKALDYSQQACEIFESLPESEHTAIALLNRAALFMELGQNIHARDHILQATQILENCQSPHLSKAEMLLQFLIEMDED